MRKSNKREQIMQAAERLFSSRRFHEITLDDIVREASIGKGTIYTYFKDKDDLFFQVAMSGFDELCRLLTKHVTEDAPFTQQLLQACKAITAFFGWRRHLYGMLQTEDARMSMCRGQLHEQWFEKRRQLVKLLGKIIQKGHKDSLVRKDISEETLASLLLGLLRARARNLQSEGIHVSDDLLVDLFLNGAGRPKARPRLTVVRGSAAKETQA
jgi:AcrR family transcriptional regulator